MKLVTLIAILVIAMLVPLTSAEAARKPAAPTAAFTFAPSNPVTGQAVNFDGTGSKCPATPCTYTWTDEPPTGGVFSLGSGVTLTFTFQGVGTKYVTLRVRDNLGRTAAVEHDVVVTQAQQSPACSDTIDNDSDGYIDYPNDLGCTSASDTDETDPPPASTCASQPYCADFETGNLSQWWITQWNGSPSGCGGPCTADVVGNSTISATTAPPVKQGSYSGKFVDGPHFGAAANDRAEALASQAQIGGFAGQEWYYGWWTYFPGPQQDWWHAGGDWNAFTQFQNTDNSGGAIGFGLDATANQFAPQMFVSGSQINKRYIGALQYDHWYHWVVRLRYSTDPAVGLVQIWRDGVEVVPLESRATLKASASPGMYYSQGIYRGAYTSTNTVVHDGFCRAASFAAASAC